MDGNTAAASTPYCGPAPGPADLLGAWNLDPPLLVALALALLAGLRAAPRRGAFLAGWAALAVAFVSPLCALTVALFSARALHHLILLGVAAPLLALALPLRGLPAGAGFVLTSAALVAWHVPAVYAAAWDSAALYWLMQGALLLPAWALWSVLIHRPARDAGGMFAAAALVGGLAGVMGLIGAVLTFAPGVLYPQHLGTSAGFGLDSLADQRLAGLVMWVPGLVPLALLAGWLARRGWRQGLAA